MKSLNYHERNENKPRAFFLGLNVFSIILLILFFFTKNYRALFICLELLTLAHATFWFWRPGFNHFSLSWISITQRINALLLPVLLTLFYYLILTPYALLFRLFRKKYPEKWVPANIEFNFRDPF